MPSLIASSSARKILQCGQWLQDLSTETVKWSTELLHFDRMSESLSVRNECLTWLNEPLSFVVIGLVDDFRFCDPQEVPGIDSLYKMELKSWSGYPRFENDLEQLPKNISSLWDDQLATALELYRNILFRNASGPLTSWVLPGESSTLILTVTDRTQTFLYDRVMDPNLVQVGSLMIAECRLHRVWRTDIACFSYSLTMEVVDATFRP
ncbi:hypothetical protein VNI00_014917 [Paramarasmius palmivorus]|uniref:Uncharacterized protein n=1 Tax=Paramarasmius palmivorus TaxID=297713 RepID=A0AAW0BLX1_9AGAR